jgi:hypothetical protein
MLRSLYPEHPWNRTTFHNSSFHPKSKSQNLLVKRLKSLFPNMEILENYLHPDMRYPSSNKLMQLDVYMPSIGLCIEYQAENFNSLKVFFSMTLFREVNTFTTINILEIIIHFN